MYFFSDLALTLNEPEERVAPTDSRLRPDQRLMESGRWDEANVEKQRLEEKQRAVRRRREAEAVEALEEGEMLQDVRGQGQHGTGKGVDGSHSSRVAMGDVGLAGLQVEKHS